MQISNIAFLSILSHIALFFNIAQSYILYFYTIILLYLGLEESKCLPVSSLLCSLVWQSLRGLCWQRMTGKMPQTCCSPQRLWAPVDDQIYKNCPFSKTLLRSFNKLQTNLVSINEVVVFDRVDFSYWERYSKSYYSHREGLHCSLLHDFQIRCNWRFISNINRELFMLYNVIYMTKKLIFVNTRFVV